MADNKKDNFIKKANKVHNNKYTYENVIYVNSKTKVNITCKDHGDFQQYMYHHLNNSGCPKCGKESMAATKRGNKDKFIEKAREVHGDKYNYDHVEYSTSKIKVNITCKDHGVFQQSPNMHLQGNGCKQCAIKEIANINRKTNEYFIEKSKQVHGDKYNYSLVEYTNIHNNVSILCKTHGLFEQTPGNHYLGHGCPDCGKEVSSSKKRSNAEEFVEKAKLIHGDTYVYDKVNYTTFDIKVEIECGTHGVFLQTPGAHLKGQGCPPCGFIKISNNNSYDNETFIIKSALVHGGNYDYSEVDYKGCFEKVKIKCVSHDKYFYQAPHSHLQGTGCPICARAGFSKIANEWLNRIKSTVSPNLQTINSPKGEKRIVIGDKIFLVDGYCNDRNTVYEFHGDFWHGNPSIYDHTDQHPVIKKTFGELFKRTLHKELLIRNAGYNYVCVWEYAFHRSILNGDV
jgi:Zn finger protein HypA/HybF involved in hydrogenase expression